VRPGITDAEMLWGGRAQIGGEGFYNRKTKSNQLSFIFYLNDYPI